MKTTGGPIPISPSPHLPNQFSEGRESEYFPVIDTIIVAIILVIINPVFEIATSASSPALLSDIDNDKGEGGALTYHIQGRI